MKYKEDLKNLRLYLNLKTFSTSYKGIFKHDPNKIKIQLLFFDYNSLYQKRCYLFRSRNDDINQYESHGDAAEDECICEVKLEKNLFVLKSPLSTKTLYKPNELNINVFKNKIWYIVNNYNEKKEEINKDNEIKDEIKSENEDYYIIQDDIIKIGRQLYIFSEISINNENKEEKIYDINSLNKNKGVLFDLCSKPKVLNEDNYCTHIIEDLKKGKESQKFKEIKNLMDININQGKKVTKYQITLYKCKECKRFYPLSFKLDEKSDPIEFLEIKKPKDKNYIILESLEQFEDKDEDEYVIKYFYVMELTGEDEEITIGRKNNNDIILNKDETISRYHAVIKYIKDKNKLVLKNKSETTGTSVLIKNDNVVISDKKEIYLQSGTTFIEAKVITQDEYNKINKEEIEKEYKSKDPFEINENDKKNQERANHFYNKND